MFNDYFKHSWRTILRYKSHSIQNIIGLSLSLTVTILGAVYIYNEINYDKDFLNSKRVYRVNTDIQLGEQINKSAQTSDVIGPLWKKNFPEVEAFARIYPISSLKVKKDNSYISGDKAAFVDGSLFSVFNIEFIDKIADNPLSDPNTVVLTRSMARKYFGEENVAGRMLDIGDLGNSLVPQKSCKVVGVIRDFPKNVHFRFDFFFPASDMQYTWNKNYGGAYFNTYILLKQGSDYQRLNEKFKIITGKDIYPIAARQLGLRIMDWQEFKQTGNNMEYQLFPVIDIHLSSNLEGELGVNGSKQTVYILSILIIFTIFMASVNFINLSTAMAMSRARQIGIHKVIGISRRHLILQLLSESFVLVLCAALIAMGIAIVTIPFVNNVLQISLTISDFFQPVAILGLAVIIVANTLLAGLYPAFYLSGINIISALQGQNNFKTGGSLLRRSLMLFQFIIAIILIVGTITIYTQLNYVKTMDLGYTKEQVLIIDNIRSLKDKAITFKDETKNIPGIITTSLTSSLPVNPSEMKAHFSKDASKKIQGGVPVLTWWVDEEYLHSLDIKLLDGQNFSNKNDSRKVIINEEARQELGLSNAINSKIYTDDTTGYTVAGVVQNFHFETLKRPIGPVLFNYSEGKSADYAVIRFASNIDIASTVAKVDNIWKSISSKEPLSSYFLDEAFNNIYQADRAMGKAALIVSIITISICCVGLFGLITFIAGRKTKEIGVRKVLGASALSIIRLLCKDFVALIFLAFIIAAPLSWWLMNKWLQDFAYRINMEWWILAVAVGSTLIITLFTIGSQAAKAASINPAKTLKAE